MKVRRRAHCTHKVARTLRPMWDMPQITHFEENSNLKTIRVHHKHKHKHMHMHAMFMCMCMSMSMFMFMFM